MASCARLEPIRAIEPGRAWLERAVAAWAILAVAAAAKQIVQGPSHNVYPIFAAAARHWWADQSLYAQYEGLCWYLYSPTFAIAMSPLGWLPDWIGGAVWSVLGVALFLWALRALRRDIFPGPWTAGGEAVFLGLALVNSVRGIWSGQSNSLVFALAVAALLSIQRERWWRASWALAGAVLIKLWPAVLVAMLAVFWPRKLVGRVVVCAAALALAPFLTRPPAIVLSQYLDWYACLTGPLQGRYPGFRDAWTIWEQLWPPVSKPVYNLLQVATAAGVLGLCVRQSFRPADQRARLTWLLCAWIGWELLFGPGAERLTYQLYAPLTAWAVVASWQAGRGRGLSAAAWLLTGLLGTGGFERAVAGYFPAAPAIQPIGGLVFLGWMLLHFRAVATFGADAAADNAAPAEPRVDGHCRADSSERTVEGIAA